MVNEFFPRRRLGFYFGAMTTMEAPLRSSGARIRVSMADAGVMPHASGSLRAARQTVVAGSHATGRGGTVTVIASVDERPAGGVSAAAAAGTRTTSNAARKRRSARETRWPCRS